MIIRLLHFENNIIVFRTNLVILKLEINAFEGIYDIVD